MKILQKTQLSEGKPCKWCCGTNLPNSSTMWNGKVGGGWRSGGQKESQGGSQTANQIQTNYPLSCHLWASEQQKLLNPEWKANKTRAIVFLLPLIKATGPTPVYNTNIQLKIPKDSSNWFSGVGESWPPPTIPTESMKRALFPCAWQVRCSQVS